MKRWAILGAVLAVLAIDAATKALAPKSGWTWHHDPLNEPGKPGAMTTVAVLASAALLVWAFNSVGIAVAAAGVIGNISWAATTGGTPNPLVDDWPERQLIAYNVADVAIQGGAVFGALEISYVAAYWALAWRARRAILRTPVQER